MKCLKVCTNLFVYIHVINIHNKYKLYMQIHTGNLKILPTKNITICNTIYRINCGCENREKVWELI